MPITVNCACGKQYPVKEEFAGQRIKCPSCGQILTIPSAQNGRIAAQPANSLRFEQSGAMVRAPQTKRGGGLMYGMFGCGCLTVLLGMGATIAGLFYLVNNDEAIPAKSAVAEGKSDPDKQKDKGSTKPLDEKQPPVEKRPPEPMPEVKRPPEKQPPENKRPPVVEQPPENKRPPTPTVAPVGPWKGHAASVVALGFTQDGKYALSAAGGLEDAGGKIVLAPDNSVRFWNVTSGLEDHKAEGFKQGISAAAFSPDGRYLAAASAGVVKDGVWQRGSDNVIHVWDLQTGNELPPLAGHAGEVFCMAFNKNGARLISGGRDRTVRVWDIRVGKQTGMLLGHTNNVTGVAFHPGGEMAVSCSFDQTVRLWDLDDANRPLIREFKGHKDIVWAVAFSPDGSQLLSAGGMQRGVDGNLVDGEKDCDIRLWNVADAKEIKRFTGHTKMVSCLTMSRDGRRILSGGGDNTVRLWYVATGKELAKFDGHADGVRAVAFFPDGRRALSGGDDKTLRMWELPPDVADLVKNLESPDEKLRRQAVRLLAGFGEEAKPAVPGLLKCLLAGDAAFRLEVIALLTKLGGAPGRAEIPLLAQMAGDKTFPDGRLYALDALAKLGPDAKPALPALATILKEPDLVLRRKAIVLLGQIGVEAHQLAYLPLIEFLRDSDDETAKATAEALPKLGKPTKEQIEPLGRFLTDRNDKVRRFALRALADLGEEAEPMVPRITEVAKRDTLPELRKAALAALLKLKPHDKATVELMTAALKDQDATVSRQAIAALAEIGPSRGALPGMLQALEHKDEEVRKSAEEAFTKATFDKSNVKTLGTSLVLNKNPKVRFRVVAALAKIGPDAADVADDLGRVARDSNGALRLQALAAIGALGAAGSKAAPLLVEILNDKTETEASARVETVVVLVKLKAPEAEQAVPMLVQCLLVNNPMDAKQTEMQGKASRLLVQIGAPAAEPLAKTLTGEFYVSNVRTPEGVQKALARKKVLETLISLGPKANTTQVLRELVETQRSDPEINNRKLAEQARSALQKKL